MPKTSTQPAGHMYQAWYYTHAADSAPVVFQSPDLAAMVSHINSQRPPRIRVSTSAVLRVARGLTRAGNTRGVFARRWKGRRNWTVPACSVR